MTNDFDDIMRQFKVAKEKIDDASIKLNQAIGVKNTLLNDLKQYDINSKEEAELKIAQLKSKEEELYNEVNSILEEINAGLNQ